MNYRLLLTAFTLSFFQTFSSAQQFSVGLEGGEACDCSGCFDIYVTGAQGPLTFLWSNGMTNTFSTFPTFTCGFCPGTYTVTVTDNQGQTTTASGFIYPAYYPVNIVSIDPPTCPNDSLITSQHCEKVCAGTTVTYTLDAGAGAIGTFFNNWQITGASNWVIEQPAGKRVTVTWGNPGNGSISVTASTGPNCLSEDYLCVTILEPPQAVIGSTPAATNGALQVCKGQTVDFTNLSTGDADYFQWFFTDDQTQTTQEDPQHTFLNPGNHTVTLIARSGCLCADTTEISVEVLDAVAPSLDCVAAICPGETVNYSSTNACPPFTWSVSPNGVILEGGTASSDSITVQWGDGPLGVISLSAPACSGNSCPIAGVVNIPIISDNAEIRGKERVCQGSTETYTIEPFDGCGFVWTLSGGGTITEGQGTNRISIDWQTSPNPNQTHWLSVKYNNCYLGCSGQDSIPVKILSAYYLNGPVEVCDASDGAFTSKLVFNNGNLLCNWTVLGPAGNTVWTSPSAAAVSIPFNSGPGYYQILTVPADPTQTCTDKADWSVNSRPLPAKLTGIKGILKICPGVTYTYEAEGGGPESNYLWTLKNGAGPTQTFPGRVLNVTWTAGGPWWLSVAHVSNDGLGCRSDTIQVQPQQIGFPDITGITELCQYSEGAYFTDPIEKVDLAWSVSPAGAGTISDGQGTESIKIYWYQQGTHTVSLDVCGQTATFPVTVNAAPTPTLAAPDRLCPGATGLAQTVETFAAYAWNVAGGGLLSNSPNVQLGPGNYILEVTDAKGCKTAKEFAIGSWDAPDVSLTTPSPTGFCANSLFVPLTALVNSDADYTFQWYQNGSLIAGASSVVYSTNQYGDYTVVATNSHGCTSAAGPIRLFEYCGGGGQCTGQNCPGSLCPPGTVSMAIDPTARCDSFHMRLLDPNVTYQHGTAQWQVGISGGALLGTSTDDNPSFTFDNAGHYVAILVVQLLNGNTCHVYDFFGSEAVAQFDVRPGCPGSPTELVDFSEFIPSGGIASWSWDFGDPASGAANASTLRNPTHTYSPSGDYTVTLTVTGTSGCTSTATEIAEIPELPTVSFAAPALKCVDNALEFQAAAGPSDIVSVEWDFGDPASGAANTAQGSPAFHHFPAVGSYTVTATATNVFGCTSSYSLPVSTLPNNLAGTINPAAPPAICEGKSITLNAPGGAVSYIWSDDAGSTSPSLTVNTEGSYRVTVTDANGCTYAPPAVNVEVNAAPDALIKGLIFNELGQVIGVSYPSQTICAGEDAVLRAVVNGPASFKWSIGNDINQNQYFTDDRNTLLPPGNYTYSVTVTASATGCSMVTPPFSLLVNPVPSGFSISGSNSCAGSVNHLTYNGPQPPNWQLVWNTGQSGPTLNTEDPGVYQIRVINEFGCEARSNPWTVLPGPPVANLPSGCHTRCKPDTLCMPLFPTVIGWQWFQNGSPIPGATTPNFVAQQSGVYWAELTDFYGCKAQSDPLTLNLYDGYGNILGKVWSDVNNNGIIDGPDTLMSGIGVNLLQNGLPFDVASSNANGAFAFPNILSTNYLVEVNPGTLPPNWQIVIGQAPVALSGCDVEGNAALLLHYQCVSTALAVDLNACIGTSTTYRGVNIPAGSSQTITVPGPQGCDTLETVTVHALPVSHKIQVMSACPGSFATYEGVNIPAGTFKSFHYTNWLGCDSTVEVYVVPLHVSSGATTLYACPGGKAQYNGVDIPVGASQQFTLVNWLGCDSTLTVSVQALQPSAGTVMLQACQGTTAEYNGVQLPAGTSQQFNLVNWQGCDSVVTVTVQELPVPTGSATLLFACSGGFAQYNNTSIPAGTTQQFTLQTWLGCDSLVTVSVVALPPATGTQTLYACPGGSATYAGVQVPVGTSQQFPLKNWLGCDSVVTVNVAAWPTSTGAKTLYACPGGSATYAGVQVPVGTTQQFNLKNWLGCDSIVTVNVAPWPTSTGAQTLFACPGGSATYAGVQVPVGTTQQFNLKNWLGCDSIVTVNVAAWNTSSGGFTTGVCPGETFVYQGIAMQAGEVRPFTLKNWLGCDSIVTVTVNALQPTSSMMEAQVCPGENYVFDGVSIPAGDSKDFLRTNAAGCDSVITVFVNEFPSGNFDVTATQTCYNAPSGSLEIAAGPGGQGPFLFSLNQVDYQETPKFEQLPAGIYEVVMKDANGCTVAGSAEVGAIPSLEVVLPNGVLPCDSAAVVLTPSITGGDPASMSMKWWDGSEAYTALATEAGPVWLEVTDRCGTTRSEAKVEWAELAPDLSLVYVPNVIKPNAGNPENALFRPFFAGGITVLRLKFMVFDRWGNELYETDIPGNGWDGVFDANAMNPGVEVWYLEADVSICGRVIQLVKKGDVTVVR